MEEKGRILIVEDDGDINLLLKKILEKAGYETASAYSGTEALLWLGSRSPELILLDLMLPGVSGEEVIRCVRKEQGKDTPIIVLSAKSGLEAKLEAIGQGADDYITKPFEPEEVLVRIMAVLRRSGRGEAVREKKKLLSHKRLRLEAASRQVSVDGAPVSLTPHEFEILRILMEQPEKVFSREHLYELVWKNGYYGEDNTVNVHVSNIRRKISALDPGEEYIKTVWGIGFKMA